MRESTRHRKALDLYVRMGDTRSLERLRVALRERDGRAPSLRTLEEWSRTLDWQSRLDDFERAARQADAEARIHEVREMADRQVREALLLQQKGAEWLRTVPPDRIAPGDGIRAIVEGAKLERLARGASTEHHVVEQGEGDPRLKGFTDDELRALISAASRPVEGAGAPGPE